MIISKDDEIDPDDLEEIKEGNLMWKAVTLFQILAKKGVVPYGEYVLHVFW